MRTDLNQGQEQVIKAIQENTIMDFISSEGYMLDHQSLIDLAIELAYTLDSKGKRYEAIKNLREKWTEEY